MKKFVFLVLLLVQTEVMAQFSGGSGTETDPYEITTQTELSNMSTYLTKHFVLLNDITLSGLWVPVGSVASPFSGSFNGKGHTISNLKVTGVDYRGLFGSIKNATLDSINLSNCWINAEDYVGALVGHISNNSTVSNCSATGEVIGINDVGGLIGDVYANCSIIGSSFEGTVEGENTVGGLIGEVYNQDGSLSTIINCQSKGSVVGATTVGGLIGFSHNSSIFSSFSSCSVTSTFVITGGLVALSEKTEVTKCYTTGTVNGKKEVGGLIGRHIVGKVSQCFTTGNVTGTGILVAGIAGTFDGDTLINCYSRGNIYGNDNVGGISATIIDAYIISTYSQGNVECNATINPKCAPIISWSAGISGESKNYYSLASGSVNSYSAGKLLSRENLKKQESYAGWDFGSIWKMNEGVSTPIFQMVSGYVDNYIDIEGEEIFSAQSFTDSQLTINDYLYDYQATKVFKVELLNGCTQSGSLFTLDANIGLGDTAYVTYKIGSYRTVGDTTWSVKNVVAKVIKDKKVPDILSCYSSRTFNYDDTLRISSKNLELEFAKSGLTIILESNNSYLCIDDNKMYVKKGYAGDLEVEISVTDGIQVSNKLLVTFTSIAPKDFTGSGTERDPFIIENIYQLDNVRNHLQEEVSNTTIPIYFFELHNDLDLKNTMYEDHWEPIGNDKFYFSGIFNGKGHTIKNVINTSSRAYTGFFGHVNGGRIDSLHLEDVIIKGYSNTGSLVGNVSMNATISNCSASGTVKGTQDVGGLVGNLYGGAIIEYCSFSGSVVGGSTAGGLLGESYENCIVRNSSSKGSVDGADLVGGLIGYVVNGRTENCSSYSTTVSTKNFTGGLIGYNDASNVVSSYAIGDVTGDGEATGGLIGLATKSSVIISSYATGDVIGLDVYTGGLIGQSLGTINKTYATGNVKGTAMCGGLVGLNGLETITNSYSTGSVEGAFGSAGFCGYGGNISSSYSIGAITRIDNPYSKNYSFSTGGSVGVQPCYYNSDITNLSDSTHAIPLSTVMMKKYISYENWDFSSTWSIDEDKSYPYLKMMDNAPVSIGDTITVSSNVNLSSLIVNDFDFETGDSNLVAKVESSYGCALVGEIVVISDTLSVEDSAYVVYRVGEVRANENDTLWGNSVTSILVKAANSSPVLTATSSTIVVNSGDSVEISLSDVSASDSDGDKLFIVLSSTDGNCTINGNRIIPIPGFTGEITVSIAVSDGILISNEIETIITVDHATSIKYVEKDFNELLHVYPNPMRKEGTIVVNSTKDGAYEICLYRGTDFITSMVLEDGESSLSWERFNCNSFGVYTIILYCDKKEIAKKEIYIPK